MASTAVSGEVLGLDRGGATPRGLEKLRLQPGTGSRIGSGSGGSGRRNGTAMGAGLGALL